MANGNYSGGCLLARDSIRCAPQGQPAHSPGQSEAAPWVMNAVGSEAVSKVTDTASFGMMVL